MKKLILLSIFLIVGCASKTITLNTDEIKADCKIECTTFTIASNEWCDCMHQCSSEKLKVLPFNNRIYLEECRTDSTKSK
ncbi:MAG: hypothetical protein QF380_08330 [Candidatus Marinimicrobia bacterium]|jgi:hypothetical protein|nr:hypothetical protein [Candidatus Neomarinimicrobiota bacterium]